MEFDFLQDVAQDLTAPDKAPRAKVVYAIEGDFRIKRNGEIVFHDDFRKKIAILDKKGKATGDIKWIDFIFTSDWSQYPKDKPNVCFINVIEPITSDSGKVDQGAKADVKKETKVTYIKDVFIPKAAELWGFDLEQFGFIDFKIADVVVPVTKASIPKIVSSGANKGQPTYATRENLELSPISPILEETGPEQGTLDFEEKSEKAEAKPETGDDDDIRSEM